MPNLADKRMTDAKDTHTVYPAPAFKNAGDIAARREELRFNLMMAAGLYPEPPRTPLNPKFEVVGEFEGYTLKKVMFESHPGLWSTGNLYIPKPLDKPAPAILNFIGHWEPQRLNRDERGDFPQQIANFARMGFVCLVTDMIGKVDSLQLTHEYGARPEEEAWLSNGLGVQLWNNLRAVDLLCSLPEVDASRIGVTGASGGGSQTLFASLMDERIRAMAPINMISLSMQGGCRCENAPGLRRHTNNLEMCACLAPRPLFLAGSTGDWTRELMTRELPALKAAYAHFNAEDDVHGFYQDAEHQYNAKTRHEVYQFFAKYLQGRDIVWEEQPIETPDLQSFTWFRGEGHAPGFGSDSEFLAWHSAAHRAAVEKLSPEEKLRMLRWMIDADDDIPFSMAREEDRGAFSAEFGTLTSRSGSAIDYVKYTPKDTECKELFIFLGGDGGLDPVIPCLADGCTVLRANLFMTHTDEVPASRKAVYRTCFHATEDACRVQDVIMLARFASQFAPNVELCCFDETAVPAAIAMPLLPDSVHLHLDASSLSSEPLIPGLPLLGGIEGCMQLSQDLGKQLRLIRIEEADTQEGQINV